MDEQLVLPPLQDVPSCPCHDSDVGPWVESGGMEPPEGGDARMSVLKREWPGAPPQAFLDLIWEGFDA